ncbi:tight junction protein ZO-1 isoform X5 [Esox lucius]|uniref:tight junction protein ZO-1 isoform X5 n=1 Tax=Esox lucius TaxID=8010 RepID=UPI001476BE89|nr:tight junction protein ZO-1 isoform X5 [Esox lucius]
MLGSDTRNWFVKKQMSVQRQSVKKRRTWAANILRRHREQLLKELDVNKVLPYLVYDRVFSLDECKEILGCDTNKKRAEIFLDKLSLKGPGAFCAFCSVLEEVCPRLLTCFLLDIGDQPAIRSCQNQEWKVTVPRNQNVFVSQEHTEMHPLFTQNDPLFNSRVTPTDGLSGIGATGIGTAATSAAITEAQESAAAAEESAALARAAARARAMGGAGAIGGGTVMFATSTLSLPVTQGKPSLRRIKGRIHRSKSLDSIDLLDSSGAAMEETVIWEQHTVTLHRAPGFGFGIAISGGRDNPHFQSGETSIVISDVLKGGPAEGLLAENDRVVMVNAVSMDNVEHAYAVQQLRKSGKNAKITIRRKRKVQIPASRPGDRETMSEHEEDDTDEDDGYEQHSGRSGPTSAYAGASGGTTGRPTNDRERERSNSSRREHSASRERSISPRSGRSQASSVPSRPSKVTLVKSRKNEAEYGLRLASHIFVKDISPESLAARDGNIQEGDVVLKINGTVTENLSLIDAKKLIERSKGKLKMVVQRDERATLLNIPDMDDSIPSGNNSDRDDISEIHSLTSDHSNRSHDRARGSRSRSPVHSDPPSDPCRNSPRQISNGSHRSRDEERISKPGAVSTPVKGSKETLVMAISDQPLAREDKLPPLPEPKPVYAQPGQPDVDLPVSPSDAPVPSAGHDDSILRPSMKLVKFRKGESVGLRLAGGNDVGIFVAGVLEDSPAAREGLEEGDQILRVNNVDFANIIREEAVLFLLDLPRGEEVTILAQKKKDVYRRIVESDVGDSFYIRTHFEYEKESPYGLSFNKGEVFRVVDTLYNGKLGSWLAIRIGKNHQEVERGIIPNKNRAEQLSSVQYTLPKTPGGDRADFWRFRGLRSSKRNLRKSREDLSAQPVQTKFPAYERVVLREAGFLRPVVIFGPIADVAREKLSREEPDLFELAKTQQHEGLEKSEPRDAGKDQRSSGIIRLHTIKQIIDRDKHAVLDITPNAVDRLNYAQWYPIVVFLNPDSKQGVKTMRTRLCPESRKSARKLYERALKLRKNNHHLFTTTINMNSMNDGWYGALKDTIQQQQNQLVWVSEGKADGAPDDDLDLHDDRLSYLSAPGSEYSMYSTDSRHTSDYEDTDTEGGAYTDQDLDETLNDEVGLPTEPAITRSSEPVREDPPVIQEPPGYAGYQHTVQPDPLNRINPAGFKAPVGQQNEKAEAVPATMPILPHQPEILAETAAVPPAVNNTVNDVAGLSPGSEWREEYPAEPTAAPQSKPRPAPGPSPKADSLRMRPPELAQPAAPTLEPLQPGPTSPEPQMYTDPYLEEPVRLNRGVVKPSLPMTYEPQAPYLDQQPYKDYDHPPSRYDSGRYPEPKYPNFDSQIHYEDSVPHYDQQWPHYDQQTSGAPAHQQQQPSGPGYGPRPPYDNGPERDYSPPQPRYDEAPLGYDGRPRYGKPAGPGPVRYDEPPPPIPGYTHLRYDQEHNSYPPATHSPEPPKQYYQGEPAQRPGPAYTQAPSQHHRGYKPPPQQYDPVLNADAPPPPPKPQLEAQHPPTGDTVITTAPKALPPPPRVEPEDDPAMRAQSVLSRVKMFENKRSVSVDRAKEAGDTVRSADQPLKTGTGIPKANSLSNLDQEKTFRVPEPQKPQKVSDDDIVRSNHYDPDEDEEYYRKQLSYFDRRSFDAGKAPPQSTPAVATKPAAPPQTTPAVTTKPAAQPQAQSGYNYPRAESVEKRYEPVPQVTPAAPPTTLPKPTSPEDTVTTNYLPQKSYPEKSPVNGTAINDQPKAPATSGYNRYVPKPYTNSARPFERKFDSPKFNHNLLPNDKSDLAPTAKAPAKPQISPQPTDLDSGLDTFTRTSDNRSKYQPNNINAVPKAIPVSPSALEDDEEDEGHTVVATARGIFNCNGGVLSSIETGVSIIIPQGAIPEGVEQEIYFKVCRDNSILPPLDKEKGETLLSPLVMCGPHGLKFLKPVELRLPHCASMTPDGDPKSWQNKSLPGDPNYLVGANCVSVLIDHF